MTTRTTFLGLGAMGSALAAAALDAGRPSVVWNRTPGRAAALGERGATIARTVDRAITGDGPIILCLLDHQSVHAAIDPVAASLTGRVIVDLTTTTPGQARELAGWATAHGATYLNGAIMAVPEMIDRPGAVIFYSGAESAFEENRELLDLWGQSDYFGTEAALASLVTASLEAGVQVDVLRRADDLVAGGATLAPTPTAAVAASELTILSLTDYRAMCDILGQVAEGSGRSAVSDGSGVPDGSGFPDGSGVPATASRQGALRQSHHRRPRHRELDRSLRDTQSWRLNNDQNRGPTTRRRKLHTPTPTSASGKAVRGSTEHR